MKTYDRKKHEREIIIDICRMRMSKSLPALRSGLGLTQEELAEYLGITRQTVSTVENNYEKMTLHLMMALILFFRENTETANLMKILDVDSLDIQFLFKV